MKKVRRSYRRFPVALVFLVLPTVVAGLAYLLVDQQNKGLEADWRELLGGQTFLERYPPTEDNHVFVELRRLAAEIGLSLASPAWPDRIRPREEAGAMSSEVRPAITDHLRTLTDVTDGRFPAAPEEIQQYLAESSETLKGIRGLLLGAEPAVLESKLADGYERNLPNFLGILTLQRLLLVQASEQLRTGDPDTARQTIDASRRLSDATAEFPGIIAQLIAQATVRQRQPILRAFCPPFGGWEEEQRLLDARGDVFLDLELDAFLAYQASELDPPGEGSERRNPWWVRVALRDYARRLHRGLKTFPAVDPVTATPDDLEARLKAQVPRWQLVARMLLPNSVDPWLKAARLELSAELTALVFEERRRRATGKAPPPHGHRRPSRFEGLDWVYESADGSLSILLDGDMAWLPESALPARFDFPPAGEDECPASS